MILPVTAPSLEHVPSGVGQDAVYEVGVPWSYLLQRQALNTFPVVWAKMLSMR
jgi:hypothetical protein